jgi:hypothetical protein
VRGARLRLARGGVDLDRVRSIVVTSARRASTA